MRSPSSTSCDSACRSLSTATARPSTAHINASTATLAMMPRGGAVRACRRPRRALTFREPADWSSRSAHWLRAHDVGIGEHVAIMLKPSLIFCAGLSGAMKRRTIAVRLFIWFGPDGVRPRVSDCSPKILQLGENQLNAAGRLNGTEVMLAGRPTDGAVRRCRQSAKPARTRRT